MKKLDPKYFYKKDVNIYKEQYKRLKNQIRVANKPSVKPFAPTEFIHFDYDPQISAEVFKRDYLPKVDSEKNLSILSICRNTVKSVMEPISKFFKKSEGQESNLFTRIKNFLRPKTTEVVKPEEKPSVKNVTGAVVKDASDVIKRRFENSVHKYMKSLRRKELVDPAKLEEIILQAGGKDVTEAEGVVFIPSPNYPKGRVKKFLIGNKAYFLEVHTTKDSNSQFNTVTRLYEEGSRNSRRYLTKKGRFGVGFAGSESKKSHLKSGNKGSKWIGNDSSFDKVA